MSQTPDPAPPQIPDKLRWVQAAVDSAQKNPHLYRNFFRSPHHLVAVLATLGLGFLSANPLFLLIGSACYALCWVYLPDAPLFKRWVNLRNAQKISETIAAEKAQFEEARCAILARISPEAAAEYAVVETVYQSIEGTLAERGVPGDIALRHVRGILFSCLKLLDLKHGLRQSLELDGVEQARQSAEDLRGEIRDMEEAMGAAAAWDERRKILDSKKETLVALERRLVRAEKSLLQLELAEAEFRNLSEQIKLIRSEAASAQKPEELFSHIDASMAVLHSTNQWLDDQGSLDAAFGNAPAPFTDPLKQQA